MHKFYILKELIGEKRHEFELLLKARAGNSFTFTKQFALKFSIS